METCPYCHLPFQAGLYGLSVSIGYPVGGLVSPAGCFCPCFGDRKRNSRNFLYERLGARLWHVSHAGHAGAPLCLQEHRHGTPGHPEGGDLVRLHPRHVQQEAPGSRRHGQHPRDHQGLRRLLQRGHGSPSAYPRLLPAPGPLTSTLPFCS